MCRLMIFWYPLSSSLTSAYRLTVSTLYSLRPLQSPSPLQSTPLTVSLSLTVSTPYSLPLLYSLHPLQSPPLTSLSASYISLCPLQYPPPLQSPSLISLLQSPPLKSLSTSMYPPLTVSAPYISLHLNVSFPHSTPSFPSPSLSLLAVSPTVYLYLSI